MFIKEQRNRLKLLIAHLQPFAPKCKESNALRYITESFLFFWGKKKKFFYSIMLYGGQKFPVCLKGKLV